jgi:hypothetical protein
MGESGDISHSFNINMLTKLTFWMKKALPNLSVSVCGTILGGEYRWQLEEARKY